MSKMLVETGDQKSQAELEIDNFFESMASVDFYVSEGLKVESDLKDSTGHTENSKVQNAPKRRDKKIKNKARRPALNIDRLSHVELHNEAKRRYDQFQLHGELDDIDKAIEYGVRALNLAPKDHADVPRQLGNLGLFYRDRFQRLGKLDDLEKAIEYETRALDLTPDGHPHFPIYLANLGGFYDDRFKRLEELGDLEKAIELETRAVEFTPNGHPDLSLRLANLGFSYRDRFQRLGELNDLEKAIEHKSRALDLTPDGHPELLLSLQLGNLGASYYDRFKRLGELADLEKAIELESRAAKLTPDDHLELSARLNNISVSYRDRFDHLGEVGDLEKALEHQSRAVLLTPDGHPDLPLRLANLGFNHLDRFKCLGELSDLEKGIELESRALDMTPDGHPYLPLRLTNLGVSYRDRFEHLGKLDDLETAIEYQSRALMLTPDEHPDSPQRHFNQAKARFLQYQRTANLSHLEDSLNSFRKASRLLNGAPRVIFLNALHWAKLASKHSALNSMEAYRVTMDLLPQFVWLGATTSQRYQDLTMTENLAVKAAYTAILHTDYKLALEWLEHARCVVWNQTLMLRTPLDQLRSAYPELAARLQTVSIRLHEAGSKSSGRQEASSDSASPEQVGQQRRRLAKEYNNLLSEARTLPGFEDFLQPMQAKSLLRAARYGPIVVVNCHEDRCDALIITRGHDAIKNIPLPGFTEQKARKYRSELEMSLRRKGLRQRGIKSLSRDKDSIANVLLNLWSHVVKPVLDHLGLTDGVPIDDLPHITWCPTGAISFLPLHAAGDYDQPRSRVFDYAISSYTPTLTALLVSTPTRPTSTTRVLAVGQTNTPGHTPLPGTTRELVHVKSHTTAWVKYSELVDSRATITAVLDAMEQHDWVHLACHAHQNVVDSTKSGFYLHDGTLDLASINRRSFKNKGLAFLSACQTATGDERLPDEAIHLASGILMAGYPSVIATMWSVVDDDAPFVADNVYAKLMKDGKIGDGEAGKALHHAVAALRDKVGEKEFARWVPYIHIGS